MTALLHLPNCTVTADEIIPLMTKYQLLPLFLRSLILDQAIASIDSTEAERSQFCEQLHFSTNSTQDVWLHQQGMNPQQFEGWIDRQLKIRKFQQAQWGQKLEFYFLKRKAQLDRVLCSLIHTQDRDLAYELYFRIVEGEQSFAELAHTYSQGPEALSGGIVGPIELGKLHPQLAQMLYGSQPGQVWAPTVIGEWIVIARLEQQLPVQLDEAMQQYLLNELLNNWLEQQLQQLMSEST